MITYCPKKTLFFLCMFLLFQAGFVQAQVKESIDQYNERHQKTGYWKVYLNDHLIEIKDSAQAYYYAYNYYDNGQLAVYTPGARAYKKKAMRIESDQPQPEKGKPVLLNGHFRFYFKFGLGADETYKDGFPVYQAVCAKGSSGEIIQTEVLNFTQQYQGQFGSFRYTRRNLSNEIFTDEWYGKNEKGKWGRIN